MERRHLQRARNRLQRRLLGARDTARVAHHTLAGATRPRAACAGLHAAGHQALRVRRLRQPRQALGVPRGDAELGRGRGAGGAHGLGARRRVGTEHWAAAQLHCDRVPGQVGTDLDKGQPERGVGQDGFGPVERIVDRGVACGGGGGTGTDGQVPRCGVESVVEPGGEPACGELWGWESDVVEGKFEGCLGVRERYG